MPDNPINYQSLLDAAHRARQRGQSEEDVNATIHRVTGGEISSLADLAARRYNFAGQRHTEARESRASSSPLYAAAQGVTQGLTLGFGDDIARGIGHLTNDPALESASDLVAASHEDQRGASLLGEVAGSVPIAILGGAALSKLGQVAPALNALTKSTYASTALREAVLGGLQSGAMAAGQTQGTVGQRLRAAAPAALGGAVVGGTLGPIAQAVGTRAAGFAATRATARAAAQEAGTAWQGPSREYLVRRLAGDVIHPGQELGTAVAGRGATRLIDRLTPWRKSIPNAEQELGRRGAESIMEAASARGTRIGLPSMESDLARLEAQTGTARGSGAVRAADTDVGTMALEAVSSEAGEPVRQSLASRLSQARADLIDRIGRSQQSVRQRTGDLAGQRRTIAKNLYERVASYGTAPFEDSPLGQETAQLLEQLQQGDPAMIDRMWNRARSTAAARGYKLKAITTQNPKTGQFEVSGQVPDFLTLQSVLEQLDAEVHGMFKTPGMHETARGWANRLSSFRENMADTFPGFDTAQREYRAATRTLEAPEAGAGVWSSSVDARDVGDVGAVEGRTARRDPRTEPSPSGVKRIVDYMSDPDIPDEAKAAFRESALDELTQMLRRQRITTDPARFLDTMSPENQAKLAMLHMSASELQDAAAGWARVAETSRRAFGGSPTAPRIASRMQLGLRPTEGTPHSVRKLLRIGDPLLAEEAVRTQFGEAALATALADVDPNVAMRLRTRAPANLLPQEYGFTGILRGAEAPLAASFGRRR